MSARRAARAAGSAVIALDPPETDNGVPLEALRSMWHPLWWPDGKAPKGRRGYHATDYCAARDRHHEAQQDWCAARRLTDAGGHIDWHKYRAALDTAARQHRA